MSNDLFDILGLDSDSLEVRAALDDAKAAERLIDCLIAAREARHLSQTKVAERMETTQPAISKFERAGGDPRLSTLQRYARAVGLKLRIVAGTDPHIADEWSATGIVASASVEEESNVVPMRADHSDAWRESVEINAHG
jgi:transcriptional regulator with XRE-family HTH domain